MLTLESSHYWSFCPMTCTRCGAPRHIAKYCDEFEFTQGGTRSMPRACGFQPPTVPASDRERMEHEHGETSLPQKPVKTVPPNRDGAERPQPSRPKSIPTQASESRKSAPVEESVSVKANDRHLQRLRDTPIPPSSPQGRTSTTSLPDPLTVSTQAPGKVSTSPSTHPTASPRDPRLRRAEPLTLRASPLESSRIPPQPGETPSVAPQTPGDPASKPPQHRPLGLLTAPLPPPTPHPQHPSTPPRRNDEPPPTQPPADDPLDALDARLAAFEEEERAKQAEHEADLARTVRRQRLEYEREVEAVISKKKHAADVARRAAVQQQEEAHERRLAELRRR